MISERSKFVDIGRRLVTSSTLITLIGLVLVFAGPYWFGLLVVLFAGLALYEFFSLMRAARIYVYRLFGVSMGVIITLVVCLEQGRTQSGEVLFLVLGCLFLFLLQFSYKNNGEALTGISLTLFGILYISWFLSFVIKIRFLPGGILWVAYLLIVTKAADIGAYLLGTAIGRHPFIAHISPKKSIEGLIGGLLLSTVVSVAVRSFLPIHFGLFQSAVLGLLVGGIGQIGDLSESLMKRFCNAKDSGSTLPGMGGILDAVDSILFTAPIFYFHLKIFY